MLNGVVSESGTGNTNDFGNRDKPFRLIFAEIPRFWLPFNHPEFFDYLTEFRHERKVSNQSYFLISPLLGKKVSGVKFYVVE